LATEDTENTEKDQEINRQNAGSARNGPQGIETILGDPLGFLFKMIFWIFPSVISVSSVAEMVYP